MTRVPLLALLGIGMTFSMTAVQPLATLAQDATPEAECVTTTPEENKSTVEAWFAALSSGAPEGLADLAAEDIVYHDPSPDGEMQTGDESAEQWADTRQADFPDLNVTVEQMVAEGDWVASMQRYTGTQEDDSEDGMGVPVTGVNAEWVSMAQFRFECGKVAEVWAVADDLGRLQRQGVITTEELASAENMATPAP